MDKMNVVPPFLSACAVYPGSTLINTLMELKRHIGLLLSPQFLCTLTHSPTATSDGGMIVITQQDHKLFKILALHRGEVKLVVQALSGKKKKGGNDVEMGTDDEED